VRKALTVTFRDPELRVPGPDGGVLWAPEPRFATALGCQRLSPRGQARIDGRHTDSPGGRANAVFILFAQPTRTEWTIVA
jgi:hypothetical protein